jgi:hypothetical protein
MAPGALQNAKHHLHPSPGVAGHPVQRAPFVRKMLNIPEAAAPDFPSYQVRKENTARIDRFSQIIKFNELQLFPDSQCVISILKEQKVRLGVIN